MIKRIAAENGQRRVLLMDSISHVDAGDAGHIVVSASHGGVSSGEFASRHPLAAVFFNDAGVGKDRAGIAALSMLEVPAGAVSHASARIGDAEDMWRHGVLSHLNAAALSFGLKLQETIQEAAAKLLSYQLSVEVLQGYVHAKAAGERTPENALRFLKDAYAACVKSGRTSLLVEMHFSGPSMSPTSIFDVISDRVADGLKLQKIAYVDASPDLGGAFFAETVAMNRGVNVRLFRSLAEATAWLLH